MVISGGQDPLWSRRFSAPQSRVPVTDSTSRKTIFRQVDPETGLWQVWAWDRASGDKWQVTSHDTNVVAATLEKDPDGEPHIWWFGAGPDSGAAENGWGAGHWYRQPWGAGRADAQKIGAELPPHHRLWNLPNNAGVADYNLALSVREGKAALGLYDAVARRSGMFLWRADQANQALEMVYEGARAEFTDMGSLSLDGSLLAVNVRPIAARHTSRIEVVSTVGGKGFRLDGAGRTVQALDFSSPDGTLLVRHDESDKPGLLLWHPESKDKVYLDPGLDGELCGQFYPDGKSILIACEDAGRTTLHRYFRDTGKVVPLETPPGKAIPSVRGPFPGEAEPVVEYCLNTFAKPAELRAVGRPEPLVAPPVGFDSVEAQALKIPGFRLGEATFDVPVLLAQPDESTHPKPDAGWPLVLWIHGGPTYHEEDVYRPDIAALVDAGIAVGIVNYPGSTGNGRAYRLANVGRPGRTEADSLALVRRYLVDNHDVDPANCGLHGDSWGGFVALHAAGTQPGDWKAICASVPIAHAKKWREHWVTPGTDTSGPDNFFGGSPTEVPEVWEECDPMNTASNVSSVLRFEIPEDNDGRTPVEQVMDYVTALETAGKREGEHFQIYRAKGGHAAFEESPVPAASRRDFFAQHLRQPQSGGGRRRRTRSAAPDHRYHHQPRGRRGLAPR